MKTAQLLLIITTLLPTTTTVLSQTLGTCQGCWCIPDDGPGGGCPEFGNVSEDYYDNKIRKAYLSHELVTPSEELPRLIPNIPGGEMRPYLECQPYKELISQDPRPPCRDFLSPGSDAVCGFVYLDNKRKNRKYELDTYENEEAAHAAGAVVTHVGVCGVCSNANDLAINMKPNLLQETFQCALNNINRTSSDFGFPGIFTCMTHEVGFTEECGYLWANDVIASLVCLEPCLRLAGVPPSDPETCQLNECIQCNEENNGPIFKRFSGLTRRNSGIRTIAVRDCSSIANIEHDPNVKVGRSSLRSTKKEGNKSKKGKTKSKKDSGRSKKGEKKSKMKTKGG